MSKLTTAQRNALPAKDFAIPSERKYPIEDEAHRQNAKARASEMEHKGKLSASTEKKVFAKANHSNHKDHDKFLHNIKP